jgi:hypothetical protein
MPKRDTRRSNSNLEKCANARSVEFPHLMLLSSGLDVASRKCSTAVVF